MKKSSFPDLVNEIVWEGKPIRFELYLSNDFSGISGASQVYAFVLDNQNRLLLVSPEDRKWTLPGGTIEPGETYLETLKREVYEEAAIVIDEKTAKPFFYQKVLDKNEKGEWILGTIQIRFVCRMTKRDKFVSDPGGNTKYQIFVPISELHQYLLWGDTVKFIQENIVNFLSV